MAWREVNLADVEREALRQWHLRAPDDVERRRRDEISGAGSGTRQVPLPSPALGLRDEWSRPIPVSTVPLPTGWARPVTLSPIFPNDASPGVGFSAAPSARSMSCYLEQPDPSKGFSHRGSAAQPQRHGTWMAGRQPGALDPARAEVFQRGPDGKLHAVPGWRTTGPFEFGEWSRMFDWGGVVSDLTDINAGALGFIFGGGIAGEVVKGLGYKIGPDIVRGIIHGHHTWPKFMGGPSKQDLGRLYESIHRMFHDDLARALKEAGFPRVGGRRGGTEDWTEYFRLNPGKQKEAIDILRRVTRDFDRKNGTKISDYLDDTLAKGNTRPSAPPR